MMNVYKSLYYHISIAGLLAFNKFRIFSAILLFEEPLYQEPIRLSILGPVFVP